MNSRLDWDLGFELLRAAWLPALCVAPILLALGLWSLLARQSALRRLFDERFARRAQSQVSRLRGAVRVGLCACSALCIALALLGPTRGWSLREARQQGIDVVVCIDTSRSMLARDLRPDRLTRAKREVQGLLGQLAGNRLALVAFAGDARDIAPLTRDKTALARLLEPLTPDDNRQGGTNLAAAIERALALFDGRSGAHEAIVLVTDGEDLEGKGLEAATKAAERGIRTWVVGIGTAAGGKIPLSARDGREGYLTDADGKDVVTQLAGTSLERLATSTGGDYLSTEQSPTPLEDLYKLRIQRLETRALEQGLVRIPHDRYQWFLLPGLALALLAALIGERRAPRAASVRVASLVVLALAAAPARLSAQDSQPAPEAAPPAAYAGSSARGLHELVEHVRAGRREEALALSSRLLERRGTHALDEATEAQILYATGHALAAAKLPEDALRAFSSARVLAGPGELRLWSSYNAGGVALAQAEELRAARAAAAASGAPLAAPAPNAAAPGGAAPGGAAAADPAAERAKVKDAYQQARALLLDRLRLDGADADTRANLELAVRRLRELEREEQAEQQKQQQDQPQDPRDEQKKDSQDPSSGSDSKSDPESQPDPKQQDPSDPKQQDPSKQDPSKGAQGKPDPNKTDDKPADPQQGEQPQQQDAQGEPKPDEKPAEPKPTDAQKPGEEKPGAEKPGDAQPPPPGLDPSKLTREELVQLLDRLADIEKEAQRVRMAQRRVGRKPVEKDW
ncbi:MAG: VWA domain-containing protein [Planctomycetota bacterium]|nr:MAG: VWA domain-containing protein [Planctomycetota bacterium]